MDFTNKAYGLLNGDKLIWAIFILLGAFSLLLVYSSTGTIAWKYNDGNVNFYLIKHFLILCGGLGLGYFCHKWHYTNYSKIAPFMLIAAISLLVLTLIAGTEINYARRWLTVPIIGITFQPSDFAKIALIVYLSRNINDKQENIKELKEAFIPLILPVVLVCGLIAPADLSSALLLFLTCLIMMSIGRVATKYIIALFATGMVLLSMLIVLGMFAPNLVRTQTWENRMSQFINPDGDAYQVQQAKIAISSGGWTGVGPGKSSQRNFLPSPYSDFIFAIVCEEYGLIGSGFIMLLYLMLLFRCIRLVTVSNKTFGSLLVIGLGLSLVIQALANMAVSVNLLPVTGLTLPMVSMGGTSILFTSVAFGIILSVSSFIEKKAPKRARA